MLRYFQMCFTCLERIFNGTLKNNELLCVNRNPKLVRQYRSEE